MSGELLTLRLLAPVVLNLDVEVEAAFAGIEALAGVVGALEASSDLETSATLVLLASLLFAYIVVRVVGLVELLVTCVVYDRPAHRHSFDR